MTIENEKNNAPDASGGKYVLLIIVAGLLWGIISVFVRRLNASGIDALQIAFIRSFVGTLAMAVTLLIRDPHLLKIRLRDCWMFAGTGLVSLSLFNFCYFTVIERGEASVAVVLLYTSPIWVMLMSAAVFKEKITVRKLGALVMTFAGCVLVSGISGGGSLSLPLVLVGIASGVCYGLYSIFGRIALQKYHTLTISFYTFLFSLLGISFFSDFPQVFVKTAAEPVLILWELALGVVCTVIPYLLYTTGLKYTEPGRAAIYATTEPLIGSLVGIILYRESCGALKICGMVLILASVLMLNVNRRKKSSQDM